MTNTTNYAWLGGATPNTEVGEDDWNRLTEGLDRLLGAVFGTVLKGVINGWEIQSDGTITAGNGIVGKVACATTTATDLSPQVIADTRNFVYATPGTDAIETGLVTFVVTSNITVPAGGVRLGAFDVSALGVITNVDNNPNDYLRDYALAVAFNYITDTITATIVPGAVVEIEVDHTAERIFTVAFPPEIITISEGFTATIIHRTPEGTVFTPSGGFIIEVAHADGGSYSTPDALTITWGRWGF